MTTNEITTGGGKTRRDLNFELLRILSIISIVTGHLGTIGPSIFNPLTALGDVNCFILITGYFLIDGKFKAYRFIRLVAETIFYCFSISAIFYIIYQGTSIWDLIKSLMPFAPHSYSYWFINKFLALLLFQPFLCIIAAKISKKQYQYLLLILYLINSELIMGFPFSCLFDNGWSLPWFITLFFTGGYVKKYQPFNEYRHWGVTYLVSVFVFIIVEEFGTKIFNLQYNQWFFFAKSFCIFMWIRTISIPHDSFIGKIITFFAPNVLAVYLIHNQHSMITWLISIGTTVTIGLNIGPATLLWCMISFGVILACTLIDKTRIYVFNKSHITKFLEDISTKIDNKLAPAIS